ncbi:MAG: right-handed parallel beta-helix repeat-containing protein [Bacteroidales bacterium]|nr:right-handed parallel beta-helix repeat-containing protein [Bacteroidales bacterium]
MRYLISLIVILFSSVSFIFGQEIRDTDKWFDGSAYYSSEKRGDDVYSFVGISADGTYEFAFMLQKEPQKGKYSLQQCLDGALVPFRTPYGTTVDYIDRGTNRILTFLDEDGDITWTLVATSNTHQDCLATEFWAKSQPLEKMCSNYIMNTHYLSVLSKSQLQYMLEILEEDMSKNYVEIINMGLIRSELEVPDFFRVNVGDIQALAEAGPRNVVTVTTAAEFINALKSNTTIYIPEGTRINISEILREEQLWKNIGGRMLGSLPYDMEVTDYKEPVLFSEWVVDGNQLTIMNMNNISIIAQGYAYIEIDSAYAYVLNFINCQNIHLEGLILGHTVEGFCTGGVVGTYSCKDILLQNCDLYGCGAYGIVSTRTDNLNLTSTIIRDCSYGIMQVFDCNDVTFYDCDFYRNREYTLVEITSDCSNILFDECRFRENNGVLFSLGIPVKMRSCRIVHNDMSELGNIQGNIEFLDENTFIQLGSY